MLGIFRWLLVAFVSVISQVERIEGDAGIFDLRWFVHNQTLWNIRHIAKNIWRNASAIEIAAINASAIEIAATQTKPASAGCNKCLGD